MTDDSNRSATLAAMYGQSDDYEDVPTFAPVRIAEPEDETPDYIMLKDGTVVPSMAYVSRLERRLQQYEGMSGAPTSHNYVARLETQLRQQQKSIEQMRREFQRLMSMLSRQRGAINQHAGRMNDMSRDLDSKIDRRYDF